MATDRALPKEKDTNEIVASDDRIESLEQIEALRSST